MSIYVEHEWYETSQRINNVYGISKIKAQRVASLFIGYILVDSVYYIQVLAVTADSAKLMR
jgi:hypothetical protein